MKKLTNAQRRVLQWIGKGWSGYRGAGTTVHVNGKRICNIDTMTALQREGLVEQDENGTWKATPRGEERTTELGL